MKSEGLDQALDQQGACPGINTVATQLSAVQARPRVSAPTSSSFSITAPISELGLSCLAQGGEERAQGPESITAVVCVWKNSHLKYIIWVSRRRLGEG